MTIRTLIKKITNAEIDKIIDVVAWRKRKGLSDTEKAYFNIYIAKHDQQSFNKKASTIIPETGASMRNLIEKLTDEEMDREIDIIAWRKEKDLPDTEKAHLQAFICRKDGKSYIRLFDLVMPEQNNIKLENHISYNIKNRESGSPYYPTKEDFKNALRDYSRRHNIDKEGMPVDNILDIMEKSLSESGYTLADDWRSITEQNIATWSREGD